jgi:3-oxoadipate enol-lactonase
VPLVRAGAARLHYERQGTGEPLLLVTGFAISSEVFTPVVPAYAEHFDLVRFDNRGAGRSTAPWRPTSMPELAADAVRLLDALGLDSAHVYGLSMGGMVAQEMALRFPDRVRGLVLGATSPGGPRSVPPSAKELAAFGLQRTAPAAVRAELVGGLLFTPEFRAQEPALVREYLRHLGAHRASARGLGSHLWASAYHDTFSRLGRIAAPTLVLHGTRDTLTPVANGRILAGRIPGAELVELPDAGHAYLLEKPKESLDALVDFMARRRPVAGRPLSGVAARTEPLTRALGLPVGVARTGLSLAALPAAWQRRQSGR